MRKGNKNGRIEPVFSLLSVDEAAEACSMSRVTLYRLWARGDGPLRTRVSGRVYVAFGDIMSFLASCRETREV